MPLCFLQSFWVYSSSLFRFVFPTGNHKMIGSNLATNLRWALDILGYPCLNQYGTFYMLCTSICFTTNRLLTEYSVSFRNLHTPDYWLKYLIAVNLILILAVRIKDQSLQMNQLRVLVFYSSTISPLCFNVSVKRLFWRQSLKFVLQNLIF